MQIGTVYLKYPGTEQVIIDGMGTETSPITRDINTLVIGNADISVESSVTIEKLVTMSPETACKLTVHKGNTLTATIMGGYFMCYQTVSINNFFYIFL